MEDLVFLFKDENGKLKKTDYQNARYVRMPISEFNRIQNYDELLLRIRDQRQQIQYLEQHNMDNTAAETVTIPVNEYNGLQKAIRMLGDRSMHEIDKAKADKHGYTLKFADFRKYSHDYDEKAWLITKVTPHSIRMTLEDAAALITQELRNYYNYIDKPVLINESYSRELTVLEVIRANMHCNDNQDWVLENSAMGRNLKLQLNRITGPIILETARITANHGQGVYEITYWATGLI